MNTQLDGLDNCPLHKRNTAAARSAFIRACDSPEKLRSGDAWRVYDAALEFGVVAEVKNYLRNQNPSAFAAMCEYEADEIEASLKISSTIGPRQ